jgi:hypothetical protein
LSFRGFWSAGAVLIFVISDRGDAIGGIGSGCCPTA